MHACRSPQNPPRSSHANPPPPPSTAGSRPLGASTVVTFRLILLLSCLAGLLAVCASCKERRNVGPRHPAPPAPSLVYIDAYVTRSRDHFLSEDFVLLAHRIAAPSGKFAAHDAGDLRLEVTPKNNGDHTTNFHILVIDDVHLLVENDKMPPYQPGHGPSKDHTLPGFYVLRPPEVKDFDKWWRTLPATHPQFARYLPKR